VPREDPDRLVRDVGRRIAELRRAANMTQEQLAEALNASVQYVSRIEIGENLTLHTLAKVANALHVPVAALFEAPGPKAREVKRGRPRKAG
jgi:transcriptional regulator with XRE-family HTH domain